MRNNISIVIQLTHYLFSFPNGHTLSHSALSSSFLANCLITCSFIWFNASRDSSYLSGLTIPCSGNSSPILSLMERITIIPRVTQCVPCSLELRDLCKIRCPAIDKKVAREEQEQITRRLLKLESGIKSWILMVSERIMERAKRLL